VLLKTYLWNHKTDIAQRIKAHQSGTLGTLFYLQRPDLENATARYLALPFRACPIDRLLVDCLIASEVFALGLEPGGLLKKRRTRALLQKASGVYGELNSDGAISAPRIRELATDAAKDGVIWPRSLFALLDDIIAR
jgi:hypothetical protein